MTGFFAAIGSAVRQGVAGLGHAAGMFFTVLGLSPALLRRFRLVTDQIFFVGNLSLVIIAVSGLFGSSWPVRKTTAELCARWVSGMPA